MKIVQLCEQFPPAVGGLPNHVYTISRNLSKKHDVTVFTSDILGYSFTYAKTYGVQYEKISENLKVFRFKTCRPYLPYLKTYGAIPKLTKKLIKTDCDIIHAHSYMVMFSDINTLIKYVKKKPVVLTIHGYRDSQQDYYINFYNYSIGKITLNSVDKIIVLSNNAKKFFSKLVNEDKITVIPNGICCSEYKNNINKKNKIILFVGNLNKNKGVQYMLTALPEIIKQCPDAMFIIVGDGYYKKYLQILSKKLNISEHVIFKGFLFGQDLIDIYSIADVFVLPSSVEGLPTVILEAMASGLPVVATDVGDVSTVVKNNMTGFLINQRDTKTLSNAVLRILTDDELAKNLGKNAKKISSKYDYKYIVQDIEETYNEVVRLYAER